MHRAHILREIASTLDDELRSTVLSMVADEVEDQYNYHEIERDGEYIERRLERYFDAWGDGIGRVPLDGTYYCAWKADIKHFMSHHWGDELDYVRSKYDCETFAFRFKADADQHGFNNVGVVVDWSNRHAYNIAVYPGANTPSLIEPQSNEFVTQEGALYDIEHGIVLI